MDPIRTLDQVDRALAELSTLNAHAAAVKARLEADLAETREGVKADLIVDTPLGRMPMDEWRKQLEAEIETYCEAEKAAILSGDAKSRKLPHGTFGWRSTSKNGTLAPIEGRTMDDVVAKLRDGVMPKLTAVLDKHSFTEEQIPAALLLTVDVSLNLNGLSAALDQRRVTESQLATLGLRVLPPEDRFFCTPAKAIVGTGDPLK